MEGTARSVRVSAAIVRGTQAEAVWSGSPHRRRLRMVREVGSVFGRLISCASQRGVGVLGVALALSLVGCVSQYNATPSFPTTSEIAATPTLNYPSTSQDD